MVSLRLGSDVLGKTQNTWKLPDISSLHNVSKTGTSIAFDEGANLYFLQKDIDTVDQCAHTDRKVVANRLARRPQRSDRRSRQREDRTPDNRFSDWWS